MISGSILSTRSRKERLCALGIRFGFWHFWTDGILSQSNYRSKYESHGNEIRTQLWNRNSWGNFHFLWTFGQNRGCKNVSRIIICSTVKKYAIFWARKFKGIQFSRIIEACGNAGFLTGSFSMIAKEFPDNVATMFAILETFFGIGMILGKFSIKQFLSKKKPVYDCQSNTYF